LLNTELFLRLKVLFAFVALLLALFLLLFLVLFVLPIK